MVSNNIQREQGYILIRDLLPATPYEFLVAAQNQVGTTELKYRLTTLDSDGHQVSNSSPLFPFLGSLSPSAPDEDEEYALTRDIQEYAEENRRDTWLPGQASVAGVHNKPLIAMRNLLGSPLALVISLSLFLGILLLLVFYRTLQDRRLSSSDGTLSSTLTHKSSGNGSPSTASVGGLACASTNNISSTMLEGDQLGQQLNLDNEHRLADGAQVTLDNRHHYGCSYQTFCPASSHNQNSGCDFIPESQTQSAGVGYTSTGTYASVQRQPLVCSTVSGESSQDQCLMQMLLLGNGQPSPAIGVDQPPSHYSAAAALATLARTGKLNFKATSASNQDSGSTVTYSPITYSSATTSSGGQRQYHVALDEYQQRLNQ